MEGIMLIHTDLDYLYKMIELWEELEHEQD
jgi:hypothetical protein